MDLSEVQKRMESLQKNSSPKKTKSYDKEAYWKPTKGTKSVIRIVPYKYNPEYPFSELYFHYNIARYPMLALSNFEEADPIIEFAHKLQAMGDKENYNLGRKLLPKMRVFAPVVVRGEEDKGVRFWEFGSLVYKELLGILLDEDYGNITDVQVGRDITVEVIPKEQTGKIYDTTMIRAKPNQTPLSDNPSMLQDFLENQKELIELYNKLSFDEIKGHLEAYLQDDDEDEDVVVVSNTTQGKTNLDDQVRNIFGD